MTPVEDATAHLKAIPVADDDVATRAMEQAALSEVAGWVVTAVADGAAVLEALETVRPHLIVLDVNMPGLDGISTYRLLRERADAAATVPVLFVSAEPLQRSAELDGVFGWLAKPFDVGDLVARAAALLSADRIH